jgi:hypothetical protein
MPRLDLFGLSVQNFNFKGQNSITTSTGYCLSVFGIIVILAFTFFTSQDLFFDLPVHSTRFEDINKFQTEKDTFDLVDTNFKCAFRV